MKIIFLISSLILTIIHCKDIPKIDVYFETLCTDCHKFINTTFAEFQKHPGHLQLANVTFHPYGNATEDWVPENKTWTYTCENGEVECHGNIIETCAKAKMPQEDFNNFIVCVHQDILKSNFNFNASATNCLINKTLADNIITCSYDLEGNRLENDVAMDTPDHDYVPWITVNGYQFPEVQMLLMNDMTAFLCDYMEDPTIPGCNNTMSVNRPNEIDYSINISKQQEFLKLIQ
jgi:hypothetical protein